MIFLALLAVLFVIGAVMGFVAMIIAGIAVLYDNRRSRRGTTP